MIPRLVRRFFQSPRNFRRLMNCWPPYLGAGIRVRHISPDWREIKVELPLTRWNANAVGTQFGGSLFAMTDPFFMLMLMHALGPDYRVWDRSGSIDFLRPGQGRVRAVFRLGDEQLALIRRHTADGDRHLETFEVDITDEAGEVVARVQKVVYVRRSVENSP